MPPAPSRHLESAAGVPTRIRMRTAHIPAPFSPTHPANKAGEIPWAHRLRSGASHTEPECRNQPVWLLDGLVGWSGVGWKRLVNPKNRFQPHRLRRRPLGAPPPGFSTTHSPQLDNARNRARHEDKPSLSMKISCWLLLFTT